MRFKHTLLAVLCCSLWGGNVVANKMGTDIFPPIFFAGLRFWVLFPLFFVLPLPRIPLKDLLMFSLTAGFLMTTLMAIGLQMGVSGSAGAILIQSSSFFAMGLSSLLLNEHFSKRQIIGALIGVFGVYLMMTELDDVYATFLGAIAIIGAALSWAFGNIQIRRLKNHNIFSLSLWMGCIPMALDPFLSIIFEGTEGFEILFSVQGLPGLASALYAGYVSVFVGSSLWAFLLNKYPPSFVAPFQVVIPLSGVILSYLLFDDVLTPTLAFSLVFVVTGLAINQWNARKKLTSLNQAKLAA